MLDIGTSGYTNPRIRCTADIGGYTGHAEKMAASSYDMFLNLSTARTDGGWMYFKIKYDDYMQLPSSDNNVSFYKDTTVNGTLGVQRLSITNTSARPIEINNAMHNGPYLVAISQNYNNNYLLFALRCRPLNQLWCFGVATSNQYIISHENSTKFSIQPNGNTAVSGNLDVNVSNAPSSIKAYNSMDGYTSYIELEAKWNSQSYQIDQERSMYSSQPRMIYTCIVEITSSIFTKLQQMLQMTDLKKTRNW